MFSVSLPLLLIYKNMLAFGCADCE